LVRDRQITGKSPRFQGFGARHRRTQDTIPGKIVQIPLKSLALLRSHPIEATLGVGQIVQRASADDLQLQRPMEPLVFALGLRVVVMAICTDQTHG
jgi:hypothetical protein